jgi:hypothetical protein
MAKKGDEGEGYSGVVNKYVNIKAKKQQYETTFDQDVLDFLSTQAEKICQCLT